MKIAIIAIGTRGDVQPCIALAEGLIDMGVQVFIATHLEYKNLVVSNNVTYFELKENPANEWNKNNDKKINLSQLMEDYGRKWLIKLLEGCKDVDAIVYTPLFFLGNHLAEKLNIPYFPILFEPNIATKAFATPYLSVGKNIGGFFNKFTHIIAYESFWIMTKKITNRIRRDLLELNPSPFWGYYNKRLRNNIPYLCAFENYIIEKPKDWGNNICISGYLFKENKNNFQPDVELVQFLKDNDAIYWDFGSFSHDVLKNKINIIFNDLLQSGEKLLIDPGKIDMSNFKTSNKTKYITNKIPHAWILPRVKMVICHGGVGVVHAALKAGTPIIPVTLFPAQHYWGKKVFDANLGANPIKINKLKPGQILNAINLIKNNEGIKINLNLIRKKIKTENSVKFASNFIINRLGKA